MKSARHDDAPGRPGIEPRWTSSAKSGVGTAAGAASQVWFTVSHGILNEIYWPEVDRPCTRDMEFLVADGANFFSEEKRDTKHTVEYLDHGVPAFRLINECEQGRYRIEKEIISDPHLDVLLMRTNFRPGDASRLDLYILLAPHLDVGGAHNEAWIGNLWGEDFLFAQRKANALALACSVPFLKCSAGYVGASDGWQDLHQHKKMEWSFRRARCGNVALTAQIDLEKCNGEFTLALGFDSTPVGAAHHARASLLDGFEAARDEFVKNWRAWQKPLQKLERNNDALEYYRISTAVLHTHQAKKFPGGIVASLSVPWGFSKGDADRGGYHLVWVRDLAQVTGGLLAAGAALGAARVLRFLSVTQEPDGSWPQNMWVAGIRYWHGEQMDESAFPVLLTATALREKLIDRDELERLWPMVRKALCFIVQRGPATEQDRWEEVGGYSPYTIAVEIAALLEAAEFSLEPEICEYLRETADAWNESIERWTYASRTELARKCDVDGYYVRIAPQMQDGTSSVDGKVQIKNMPEPTYITASEMVCIDALALVRFGLRAPDDPRILNTVKVIDSLLKVETPHGPCWHRYNHDGYGEHEDGAPFDGTGIGRAWPLLTGERAHYEIAAGRKDEARRLMQAIEAFTSDGGMIPEQIWDAADIPERALYFGRPSGSGMPLVWAHAEYIKLARSIRDGEVFDMPPCSAKRYLQEKIGAKFASWRFADQISSLPPQKNLRIEVLAPAMLHWSTDDWTTAHDSETRDTRLGVHVIDLARADLPATGSILFTFRWQEGERWEGRDFRISLEEEAN
ncbi:MAG: glucan 1,4-alpha-glucosidase [Verrucomicrobia bacterium]|nr:glucan 1,4-alpha-glucosidase [Verrucomicrobiota bacterium]